MSSIAVDTALRNGSAQYRSTRTSRFTLAEMLDCAAETLDVLGLPGPADVAGHSMSALCAFCFAVDHPGRAARVVLIGTPPGSGLAIVRYRAMPFCWPPWRPDLWRMLIWGNLLARGRGSLATHKKLDLLQERANFADKSLVSPVIIDPGDRHRPPPPRDRWWLAIRKVRLVPHASDLRCPVLLIVGRHDPQAPVRVSRALHARIGGSQLVIFERSGHSPFIEEPELFAQVLTGFLPPGRSTTG